MLFYASCLTASERCSSGSSTASCAHSSGGLADLVQRGVAVIATPASTPTALAAKAATTAVPIVFGVGADPVEIGLVASLNRPGGNVTGISSMNAELGTKRLGLLHELLPRAIRFAALINPNNRNSDALTRDLQATAITTEN